MLYRELQAGDNLSFLHFVNLFPPAVQYTPLPFRSPDFTFLSLSLFLSPSRSFSRSPHRADLPLSLPSSFYLVILWSVHDIHFVRISRGGFQARKPPPSRGSMSGKRETSNGFALSSPPLSLLLDLPIRPLCLSFPPYLFVSRSLLSPISPPLRPPLSVSFSPLAFLACLPTERWWSRG